MSDDLIQIVCEANTGSEARPDAYEWEEISRGTVPAANRRRLLDREHGKGCQPDEGGWLYCRPRPLGAHEFGEVWQHHRIRWEDPRLTASTS